MSRLVAVLGVAFLLALLGPVLSAAPPVAYPDGYSVQTFEEKKFELLIPTGLDRTKPCSLLLAIQGIDDVANSYAGLLPLGFVICAPKARAAKSSNGFPVWSAGEVKEMLHIVDHLTKVLPVGKERIHATGYGDAGSILSLIALAGDAPFASACYIDAPYRGGSVAPRAKKSLGVLAYAGDYEHRAGVNRIVEALTSKVRSVEYRVDPSGIGGPYFAYWVGVMEGRFEPGRDFSFDWIVDGATPSPAATKPGAPAPAPGAPVSAWVAAKDAAKAKHVGALVYFWSADDATKPEAKSLQNTVFFDPDVRAAVKSLVAVKLDRSRCADAFTQLGLTSTPSIALVDADFNVLERFEGAVKVAVLTKALLKVAGTTKPK